MPSTVIRIVLEKIAHVGRSEEGQDLVEYGLLMALIAVVAIGAVSSLGNIVHTVFWRTIAVASNF